MKKIKVTLKRSLIGRPQDQKSTVLALGLKKIGSSVLHEQTPQICGMIKKVKHLVAFEEVDA